MELSHIYISSTPDFEKIESELRKDYATGGISFGNTPSSAFCSGERIIPTSKARSNDHYLDALRYLSFGLKK